MPLIELKSTLSPKEPDVKPISTFFERLDKDVKRITNILDPSKAIGSKFLLIQSGLQLSNPKITYDLPTDPIVFPTKIYNQGHVLISAAQSPLGIHPQRHGLMPFDSSYNYETYTNFNNLTPSNNRLLKLRDDLLTLKENQPKLPIGDILKLFQFKDKRKEPIIRLSGINGPNSLYGIGATIINRYTQTYNIYEKETYLQSSQGNENLQIRNPKYGLDIKTDIEIDENRINEKFTHTSNIHASIPSNKQYISLKYNQLKYDSSDQDFVSRIIKSNSGIINFLPDLEKSGGSYKEFTRESKFGLPITDVSNANRSDYTKKQGRSDLINLIEIGEEYPSFLRDFIKFYFTDIDGNNKIIFRAIFVGGFSDSVSSGWDSTKVLGKADNIYTYNSYERNTSFTFRIIANSREELVNNYKKVNDLMSYSAPKYLSNNRMVGPLMKMTLGDYYIETPGFISSISANINDDAVWEINLEGTTYELPHYIDIQLSYTIIGNSKPELHGKILDVMRKF